VQHDERRRSSRFLCGKNHKNSLFIEPIKLNFMVAGQNRWFIYFFGYFSLIMLQLIYVSLAFYNANMKAKYAIKGLLRIHAVQQTRKISCLALHKTTEKMRLMQIEFMQNVHKHQFYAVTHKKLAIKQSSRGYYKRRKRSIIKMARHRKTSPIAICIQSRIL
jgi:hypothetical protein